MGGILFGGTASLLMCAFLCPQFITFLRRRRYGQQVRGDGPQGHHLKAGTPTMGGVLILAAASISFWILTNHDWRSIGVFLTASGCALLGAADDYVKLFRRRSLGLRGRTKLAMTGVIAVGLWFIATHEAHVSTSIPLPLIGRRIDFGPFYIVVVYLILAGTTSAVNLTDGLDGLAAGCVAIVLVTYVAIAFSLRAYDLAMLGGCLAGACVGFLWFNAFPATIFMGDTGSLGLGAAIASFAVMTKTELLLLLVGAIFVFEALSVIIQVISFKVTRRRVFLMAPVHHHFELAGWSETKIIIRFWIITAVGAAIGFVVHHHG
jgi:phospho-N-acetylmuramoyl-pentapeptide-transferase